MSMLSAQIGKLRHESDILRDHGTFIGYGGLTSTDPEMIECADLMCEAADTITELRGAVLVAGADYRQLAAENAKLRQQLEDVTVSMGRVEERCAKLRELLADTLMQPRDYCKKYGIEYESWDSANAHLDARMRELGVDV